MALGDDIAATVVVKSPISLMSGVCCPEVYSNAITWEFEARKASVRICSEFSPRLWDNTIDPRSVTFLKYVKSVVGIGSVTRTFTGQEGLDTIPRCVMTETGSGVITYDHLGNLYIDGQFLGSAGTPVWNGDNPPTFSNQNGMTIAYSQPYFRADTLSVVSNKLSVAEWSKQTLHEFVGNGARYRQSVSSRYGDIYEARFRFILPIGSYHRAWVGKVTLVPSSTHYVPNGGYNTVSGAPVVLTVVPKFVSEENGLVYSEWYNIKELMNSVSGSAAMYDQSVDHSVVVTDFVSEEVT